MPLTPDRATRQPLVIAAPVLARRRGNRNVQGFVKSAYGAAIGTILGACVLLGRIAIGDWLTILIGLTALVTLFRWRVSNPLLIAITAATGLIAFPLLHPTWVMVKPAAAADRGLASGSPLRPVADVPLGGNTTRFDYESLDPRRHLLFVAHLGDSTVIVFDTKAQRIVKRIAHVSKVHGVLAIPELGRVYASATGTNEVVAIDEGTLQVISRSPAGVYPDGMAYAPDVHKLYVSDEHGDTDTVIDTRTNTRTDTIPLGGDVGNTQYDSVTRHIFANVQTRRQLVEIDPVTDQVVTRTDLPGADGNHGLLIEPRQHWAFIACEDNHKLLVLDLGTRKVIGSFEVGADPDVLAYDPVLGYLYVAAESGIVSLFKAAGGQLEKVADVRLGANAHVVAVDADTHKTYFPLKDVDGHTILRIMSPSVKAGP